MPTTRRSSGRTATGPGKQSTLSFSSRVTKNVPKATAKDIIAADPSKATATKDEVDVIEPTDAIPAPPAAAAADVKVPAAEKAEEAEVAAEEEQDQAEESEPEVEEPEVVVRPEAAAEKRAELVSDAQVGRYWRAIEAQRTAKRVHQQDLAVGEKVLRYFDVSSHYGVSNMPFISPVGTPGSAYSRLIICLSAGERSC